MQSTPVISDTARIEELLSRLDPGPAVCQVPGCLHVHLASTTGEGVTALAA